MRDGTKQGINYEILEDVMSKTNIACVASGGVSSIEDIKLLSEKNYKSLKGVIVGKAIYDGELDLGSALELVK
jgi:phosphoribosylformimino-5-aminoimidazole carboxamide ribonucleotide (ProFAR) isomerase